LIMFGWTNPPPSYSEASTEIPANPPENDPENLPVPATAPPSYTFRPSASPQPPLSSDSSDDATYKEMILVMGMRGSGKSYFINQFLGGGVAVSRGSTTQCTCSLACEVVPARVGRSKVIFIDTPGFDQCKTSEQFVCAEISNVLAQQYQRGVSLRGVIYLQRITESKTTGSAASVLKMFRGICGEILLKNVILATTLWQLQHVDEKNGAVQERELRGFWGQMLDRGSAMARYYGDRDSGVGIVSQILGNQDIPFETEEELVLRGKSLEKKATLAREMARLQKQMEEL